MTPKTRRLPPLEIQEGESWFISWPRGSSEVNVQLRLPATGGRVYTSRATYPADLFRRAPTTGTAAWVREELIAEQHTALTNHRPRKPKWAKR